jgi:hypothetical protein
MTFEATCFYLEGNAVWGSMTLCVLDTPIEVCERACAHEDDQPAARLGAVSRPNANCGSAADSRLQTPKSCVPLPRHPLVNVCHLAADSSACDTTASAVSNASKPA